MRALAQFSYRRRRLVLAGWIALLVGLLVLSSAFGGEFRTDVSLPGFESQAAIDLLEESGVSERAGVGGQVVFRAEQGVHDPAVRSTADALFREIEANLEGVVIGSPYAPENAHQVSTDRTVAYAEINSSVRSSEEYFSDADRIKVLHRESQTRAPAGMQIELGGDNFASEPQFSSELFGILAAVLILLVVFGSVLAMGLPIITALFGLSTGAALIALVANVVAVPEPTVQIAAMLGIGVGIDYALLIVTRYRAGLHDGLEPRHALVLSLDTSGRAVVFAGLTVAISLLGMFFFNSAALRSLATGALFGVLMTMFAAITLLPAMLGFIGRNIDELRVPFLHTATQVGSAEGDRRSLWYRWSRVIQSRPWPPLILSAALLVLLTIPVFSIQLGFADASNRLETDTTRKAYDILSEGFGVGFNSPILVVVDTANGPSDSAAVAELKSSLEGTAGVASVSDPISAANGRLQLLNVFAESAPQDGATTELVHRLRDETIAPVASRTGIAILTTGGPAFVVDFSDYMRDKLPIFIGAVLVLSFFLLTAVFHSVVVPLKAVLLNLLSIGAAFGAVVVVFQWGIGADLIGIREGPFEAWAPILLFAVVFGLSMDYEVFLLTRIREQYDRTGDNSRAVADGLAATGRVISAAALIMVCVFGSFTLGDMRPIKLLGFGLAFAVLIDATVVRLILVPAAMELMGKANWWAPPWLVRYLPRLRVETVGRPVAHAERARSSP